MQRRIEEERELLNKRGEISAEGYAVHPFWRYRRRRIRAPWYRIKEWDYYAVIDQETGLGCTLTYSDLGYIGLYALCLVDLKHSRWHQVDSLRLFPAGRSGLAETADEEHTLSYSGSTLHMTIDRRDDARLIAFDCDDFPWGDERGLSGEIVLIQPADQERMVIATSWEEKRSAFYYNQKINCMPASGFISIGSKDHTLTDGASFGVLDWGRGRWTYENRWYWASASGLVEERPFGFNLGYGFSDRSSASENMLFFDGRAHKLDQAEFIFDPADYLKPWRIRSNDQRLELEFIPDLDRNGNTNFGLIRSLQHQLFGRYRGFALLDDGRRLEIDGLAGFAEDVYNRW